MNEKFVFVAYYDDEFDEIPCSIRTSH